MIGGGEVAGMVVEVASVVRCRVLVVGAPEVAFVVVVELVAGVVELVADLDARVGVDGVTLTGGPGPADESFLTRRTAATAPIAASTRIEKPAATGNGKRLAQRRRAAGRTRVAASATTVGGASSVSSSASAAPEAGRSSGRLASVLMVRSASAGETSGRSSVTGTGRAVLCIAASSAGLLASNGSRPTSIR